MLSLADMWNETTWDWNKISFDITQDIIIKVTSVRPKIKLGSQDKPYWVYNKKWLFPTQSFYKTLPRSNHTQFPFYWMWNIHTLEKIKIFLWLCSYGKILIHSYLYYISGPSLSHSSRESFTPVSPILYRKKILVPTLPQWSPRLACIFILCSLEHLD